MAFELRLTFSGLTGLVPNKDIGDSKPAEEWLVVLPALRNGHYLEKGNRKFSIAPHQPVLVVDERAVRPAKSEEEKKPRLRFGDLRNGAKGDRLLFELDRELVEIQSGVKGLQVNEANLAKKAAPQSPDELHDIKWVPPIDECVTGGLPFDRKLLGEDDRPTDRLAGVVRLDRGLLEVTDVHRDTKKKPALYDFQGPADKKPRFTQAIATSFRLRVPVDDDQAVLVFTDVDGEEKRLVVGPYEEKPVEIEVFNLELEKILRLAGGATDAGTTEMGDTDFAIFYELSPRWKDLIPNELALPYLVKPGGGGSGRPCEPPKFAGMA